MQSGLATRSRDRRALLFDLDDTLLPEFSNYSAAFASACSALLSAHGITEADLWGSIREAAREAWRASPVIDYCQQVQIGSVTALFSDFPGDAPEMAFLRSWGPTYRRDTVGRALSALGVRGDALTAEIIEGHRVCFASRCAPYDDVVPALERLGRSYRLAVITNGPADVQRAKLRTSGLERFFPTVVISSEIGFAKPHERAFAAAIDALDLHAAEIVMVGDHLERDVIGAERAGIGTAIWVDRTGTTPSPDVEVKRRITHLGEIEDVLAGL